MGKVIVIEKFFVGFVGGVFVECVYFDVVGEVFQVLQCFDVVFIVFNGIDGGCQCFVCFFEVFVNIVEIYLDS